MLARRLAAILAADVVGYSKLMAEDEAGTLAALKKHRLELFDPLTASFAGRIVKLMGDGVLVEFSSVVGAVECALAIQKALATDDGNIRLRIGINLGDVIIDGEDIYGDGVNIAARLESLAEQDSICVSDDVYRQVKGKVEGRFENLGAQKFKNIEQPVGVWRWRASDINRLHSNTAAALALPDKPSVAVLPFTNMSGDPEQDIVSIAR